MSGTSEWEAMGAGSRQELGEGATCCGMEERRRGGRRSVQREGEGEESLCRPEGAGGRASAGRQYAAAI